MVQLGGDRVKTDNTTETGCTFASAVTAQFSRGPRIARSRDPRQSLRHQSHRKGLPHRQRPRPPRPFLPPAHRAARPRHPRSPPARHAPRRRTHRPLKLMPLLLSRRFRCLDFFGTGGSRRDCSAALPANSSAARLPSICRQAKLAWHPELRRCGFQHPVSRSGTVGLVSLFRKSSRQRFIDARERWPYVFVFLGLLLTACGSAYYHLAPDNARLVWDRLPMTVVFMPLVAAMLMERVT